MSRNNLCVGIGTGTHNIIASGGVRLAVIIDTLSYAGAPKEVRSGAERRGILPPRAIVLLAPRGTDDRKYK
jgi:hypothetical protein